MSAALPAVVAEWPRSARETIRLTLDVYQGTPTVNLRVWYRDDLGELRPGKSGITLGVVHLTRLADGFADAMRIATETGLVTPPANDR